MLSLSKMQKRLILLLLACVVLAGVVYLSISHKPSQPFRPAQPSEYVITQVQMEINILGSPNANSVSRAYATRRLAQWGEEAAPAIPQLINALNDTDPLRETLYPSPGIMEFRDTSAAQEVIDTLVKIGPKAVDPLLSAFKTDKRLNVRLNAVVALVKLKDERAVQTLIQALEDQDWAVRGKAAWALGELKDKRAVEPLIACLDESTMKKNARVLSKDVVDSIEGALQKISGQDFKQDIVKWRQWSEQNKVAN